MSTYNSILSTHFIEIDDWFKLYEHNIIDQAILKIVLRDKTMTNNDMQSEFIDCLHHLFLFSLKTAFLYFYNNMNDIGDNKNKRNKKNN